MNWEKIEGNLMTPWQPVEWEKAIDQNQRKRTRIA
jgi:hypothetical protein